MGKSCRPSAVEREKLQRWIAAHGTPQQVASRCRIVLAAAAGKSDVAIAEELSVNRNTVILWRKRFSEGGADGLWIIAPGRGRKPLYANRNIASVVDAAENRASGDDARERPDHSAEPAPPSPQPGKRKSVAA